MKIEFDLKDIDGTDLSDDKMELLRASLSIEDLKDLEPTIKKLAEASINEYVEMLIGKGMPNRADESKQDRLLYIVKKVFTPRLPGEDEISIMFQLTMIKGVGVV